jgi:tRNA-dihydrouridine synthase B
MNQIESSFLPWLEHPDIEFNSAWQTPMPNCASEKIVTPIKIGKVQLPNNLVLAPMAGVTDGSFRLLCARLGAGLTISELASAKAIVKQSPQTVKMIRFQAETKPYAVQLFGSDPATMAEAARIVETMDICDIIDINMGCPVPKVVKIGAGAALMKTPKLAAEIVKQVSAAVSIPVTMKCRIGWNASTINVKDFAKEMLDAGTQAITVHARTRQAGYTGVARWEYLEGLGEICGEIPFFANGDITEVEHLTELKARTSSKGFMIGRGAVGNPWLFAKMLGHDWTEDRLIQFKIFRNHLIDMMMEHGPKAVPLFRVHLFGYLKNHPKAAKVRHALCYERNPSMVLKTGEAFFKNLPLDNLLAQLLPST